MGGPAEGGRRAIRSRNRGVARRSAILLLALLAPVAAACAMFGGAPHGDGGAPAEIDIPYQKFVLSNGLTLIVHEDHKAPIVAVNVWYHVGSKNEKPGKTGFAHLFEHLMFHGSENYDDDYFEPFERVGATEMNGTTDPDRTNYFQNVPTNALDLALFMESDRMGHLLGAIDQPSSTSSEGSSRTRSDRARTSPTGSSSPASPRRAIPPVIPTRGRPSGRWRTWTPRASTTFASGSRPTTALPTR